MADIDIEPLLEVAWVYWERALVSRKTRIGAAALAEDATVYGGCNVQQRFHSHDVHAEVNAITTMIAEGRRQLLAIAVVAEAENVAPCGSCLDWIVQIGGDDCLVVWQGARSGSVVKKHALDLIPFHPPYG